MAPYKVAKGEAIWQLTIVVGAVVWLFLTSVCRGQISRPV
jgi:hypothetical protein